MWPFHRVVERSKHFTNLDVLTMEPTKNEVDDLDPISLIKEIQGHDILYDRKSANFTSEPQKQVAWKTVAKNVKSTTSDCMAKWMNLRQRFIREKEKEVEKKMCSGGSFIDSMKSTWELMEHMRFMEPHVTLRIPSSYLIKAPLKSRPPDLPEDVKEEDSESIDNFGSQSDEVSVTTSQPFERPILEPSFPEKACQIIKPVMKFDEEAKIIPEKVKLPRPKTFNRTKERLASNIPFVIPVSNSLEEKKIAKSKPSPTKYTRETDLILPKLFEKGNPKDKTPVEESINNLSKVVKSLTETVQVLTRNQQEYFNESKFRSRSPTVGRVSSACQSISVSEVNNGNPEELFGKLVAAELYNLNDQQLIAQAKMLILKIIFKIRLGECPT